MVKKSFAIKVGAVKAAKALKIAKVAAVVATLKKHPIIVPVPVPIKLPFPFPFPINKGINIFKTGPLAAGAGALGGFGAGALSGLGSGAIGGALSGKATGFNPVQGFISGAQNLIKTASVNIPFLPHPQKTATAYVEAAPEPVYRYV